MAPIQREGGLTTGAPTKAHSRFLGAFHACSEPKRERAYYKNVYAA